MRSLLVALVFLAACGGPPMSSPDGGEEPLDAGAQPTDAGGGAMDAGADAGVDAGTGPLALQPGEVAEVPLSQGVGGVTLATPQGTEQFVVMLASTNFTSGTASYAYSVSRSAPLNAQPPRVVTGCALSDTPWRTTVPSQDPAPTGTTVDAGTVRTLQVPTSSGVETITAQAVAVGARAVVWVDTTAAHPAVLDGGFIDAFLADFENVILPRERALFGVESDLDADGHVHLVFSPLTYQTAVAFFTSCDLQQVTACPGGNHGEYLYLTPPANIAPPYNTPNAIKEILTHECGHLIHFNRKVLRNHLSAWGDGAYMDEGIGAFAQDAIGPQSGNLYVAKAGLDGIGSFSLADTLNDVGYDRTRDGVLRGGAYWFVRSVYDGAGGDRLLPDGGVENLGGPAFLRALLDDPRPVAQALPALSGSTAEELATDFFTTLAMSNRDAAGGVRPTNACFAFKPTVTDPHWNKQRGANTHATFTLQMTGPASLPYEQADRQLRGGGVDYLDAAAATDGGVTRLGFTVDAAAFPRVRVGRVR